MSLDDASPIRLLLLRPYEPSQPGHVKIDCPPLGLLYLVSTVRERLGERVEIRMIDCALAEKRWYHLKHELVDFAPHVVGLSALNYQAEESGRIALLVRELLPQTLTVLGGPFAHENVDVIAKTGLFDWIFDGEADFSFPLALQRWFFDERRLSDIAGLSWRDEAGEYRQNPTRALPGSGPLAGLVENLDDIPFPAWDLVDFDAYARRWNGMANLRGKRYAPIFTSRGCPFLCTYCHDVFGKKFRGRSPENVLAEVRLLRDTYGVDELEIMDDIFNMNSRRMKEICALLAPLKMHLCVPNGLRFDILDEEGIEALVQAGLYEAPAAIETVTPRLQEMIKKRLHLDRTVSAIRQMRKRGVMVNAFFMLGFPTETVDEMRATVDYATRLDIAHAAFSMVQPQPGTPLYEWARAEHEPALAALHTVDYVSVSWYSAAYGVDLQWFRRKAFMKFYLTRPRRWWWIYRGTSWKFLFMGMQLFFQNMIRGRVDRSVESDAALPAPLAPLRRLYRPTRIEPPAASPRERRKIDAIQTVPISVAMGECDAADPSLDFHAD